MNTIISTTVTRLTLLLSLLAFCFSGSALAHVELEKTFPADKAPLNTAPQELLLEFEHPIKLIKLTLTDTQGSPVNFNFVANSNLAGTHKFPLPSLGDGHYTVNWSATDKDGHNANGQFSFMVGPMPKDHKHQSK